MTGGLDNFVQELQWALYKTQTKCLGLNDPRGIFPGLLTKKEGITLFKLAHSLPENAVMVEIGCFGGLSSAYLLEGSKKNKAFLYSIDPFDSYREYLKKDKFNLALTNRKPTRKDVEDNLRKFGLDGFELIESFSFEVAKNWTKHINLLWIDGNHDYEAVKLDYLEWEPFLKVGGIIAFHDSNKKDESEGWSKWGWEGPTRLVKEVLYSTKWRRLRTVDSITYAIKARAGVSFS